jgi:hypothetical protein
MKPNFAKIINSEGWNAYAAAESFDKKPMPTMIYHFLQEFIDYNRNLDGTTFRYIAEYLETGNNIHPYRLEVACSDFGYTLCELDSLRIDGKTARDIAVEILGRGVRISS